MKIGIIISGNIWFAPYIKNYTDVIKEANIDYDIISWNRDGSDAKSESQFNIHMSNDTNKLKKFILAHKYAKFIKNTIKKNGYDKLIISSTLSGIFLTSFLAREYNKRYIFDFRDLSIEQIPIFKKKFLKLLSNSWLNVISSPGFVKYLPSGFNYLLSHNFSVNYHTEDSTTVNHLNSKETIKVLTIGGIRDYSSNSAIIDALSNKPNIKMFFIGKGIAAAQLETHANEIKCKNIEFKGYYPKKDEPYYIQNTTFMNIFYPDIKSHSSALSNRFYSSIIFKRPMIVTSNSIQGDFVSKYKLGIVIDNTEQLDVKLKKWLDEIDYTSYCENCERLIQKFIREQLVFKNKVLEFCK